MTAFRAAFLGSLALALSGCDALISAHHRVETARKALEAGDLGRAAIEMRKAVRSEPENPDVRLVMARLALETGDTPQAQQELDHARKAGAKGAEPDELQARIWLGARQGKQLADAITAGRLALPEPLRTIELARAYNMLGQPAAALEALAPLLAPAGGSGDARVVRVQSLLIEGRSDEALKEASAAAASDPASVDAPLLEGQLLAQRQQFAAAEKALMSAAQRIHGATSIAERVSVLGSLTEYRLAQGKLAEAAESQAALAQLLPESPVTVLLGARIELARGQPREGVADLQRVVARVPGFVPARLMLGAAQLSQGNLNQAQHELEQVLQQAPDNLEAHKLLARVQLQLNQPQAALQGLNAALAANATDPQLYSLLEATQLGMGDSAAALTTLERGVKANPANADLRLDLARAYLSAGRAKDALALVADENPQHDDPRRQRLYVAALYAVQGAGAATQEVERALQARPKDLPMLNFAASYFSSQAQLDRARALLQQALAIDAHDLETLGSLARIDLITGDVPGAEAAMRTALGAAPENAQVRIALADILTRRGAVQEARQVLTSGKDAAAPTLQFALARLELEQGDLGKANAALDQALAAQPNRAEPQNQAGLLLLQAGKPEAALARFRKATELLPSSAPYWLDLGRAELAINQDKQATGAFEKAHELNPDWMAPVSSLALIDVRAKRFDAALERAKQALAKHPRDPDAFILKGDVLASEGKERDAAGAYADAQRLRADAATALKLFRVRVDIKAADAEEPLQQWLALQPNDFRMRGVLGNYYLSQHALKKAAGEFETLVRQVPGDAAGLNNLAWIYLQMNDARAAATAQRAYQLAPASPTVADTLGWILVRQQDLTRGLPLLERASKAATGDPEIEYHYAYALAQSGKRAEARDILTRTLADKRDFESRGDAVRLLADLRV